MGNKHLLRDSADGKIFGRDISFFQNNYKEHFENHGMTITASRLTEVDDQILVFFVSKTDDKEKISTKTISIYYEKMKSEGITRSILVLPVKPGSGAEKSLRLISEETGGALSIETFLETEPNINITEHVLVPKHQLLTLNEKKQLLNRYKVKEAQLPRIQSCDPVAKYLGLSQGDVVRIIRPSETAGR